LLQPFARAAALLRLLERAAEQAASQRAPRDHPDAVRAARGEHLQLDRARAQVVEALLGDEPEEVACRRPGVRLCDLPAGEVAAGLARAVHEREAVALGGERAEVHGPEAEAADAQPGAAEMDVLHGRCPSTPRWQPYRPPAQARDLSTARFRRSSARSAPFGV